MHAEIFEDDDEEEDDYNRGRRGNFNQSRRYGIDRKPIRK
jgi:hypothetical protein